MLSIRALRASSTRDSWKRLTFGSAFVGCREMSMKGHCKLQMSVTVIDTGFVAIKDGLLIEICILSSTPYLKIRNLNGVCKLNLVKYSCFKYESFSEKVS